MRFVELLETVWDLPLFQGSLLLAGDRDPGDVRRQLSRWTASGKILQLRRNLYALASPWRRVQPHPFLIANELHHPSYVSLQSALAYHGMIPEAVPVTTSVTTARPIQIDTPFGRHTYRHVRPEVFFGYDRISLPQKQEALLADPGKALLDLVYFTPKGETLEHLRSLRLEGIEDLEEEELHRHASRWRKKRIQRAVENILRVKEETIPGRRTQA
jgi:predicted transcriptional regulator of viral defense system